MSDWRVLLLGWPHAVGNDAVSGERQHMNTIQLLRDLSEASGVSGYEDEVQAIVRKALEPHADTLRIDALGNLIALKKGKRADGAPTRAIMLAAHADEIGLMVKELEEGFIRFTYVGGVDVRTLLGQEVVVHGERPLPGIVGSRPPHITPPEQREKVVGLDELFIDVGIPEERLSKLVHVGDIVTMRRDFLELASGRVSGKAFDDRAGVVAVVECMETLSTMDHLWDVYAVSTSQEEVGLRGAMVSAYGIVPDVAIAVDVGFGAQPGVDEAESVKMDAGPAIARGPNIHPLMYEKLVATAKEHEVPHQTEIIAGRSGTDAWAIQVTREGVPCGLLSIPLRYMHTSVETVCIKDINRTGRLMALFIAGLDEDFAELMRLD